jgi:serine/threonine protein kinase/tetratricopeptide (TPR) repeat protein
MLSWLKSTDESWLIEGKAHHTAGDYAKAIAGYTKALETNPKSVIALSHRARAYYDNGDFVQAITDFGAALALTPDDAYLHGNKGLCLRALGRYNEALKSCSLAVKLNRSHVTTWCGLGYIYYCLGQYDKAIENYNTALKINRRYVAAWNYKANVLLTQGEYEKAWQANEKALSLNPANPYAIQTKALLLLQQGQTEVVEALLNGAEQHLLQQDKSPTSRAGLLTQRGQLYQALKFMRKAKAAYKAALKALPSYAIAREGLTRINAAVTSTTATLLSTTSYPIVQTTQLAQLLQNSASPADNSSSLHPDMPLESFAKPEEEPAQGMITEQVNQFAELALAHYTPGNKPASKDKAKASPKAKAKDKKLFKEKPTKLNPLKQEEPKVSHPLSSSFPTNLLNTSVMSVGDTTSTCLSESSIPTSTSSSSSMLLPSNYLISNHELTYGKKVGQGAFGEVFLGTWRHEPVAIKRLLINKLSLAVENEFKQEAAIMARLRSSYIVYLKGIVLDAQPYCIVMDWMPNGSLYERLHSNNPPTWSERRLIAADISKGLAFLHVENILHRDVKSLNVLLDEHMRAKLSDFGLSKVKVETMSKTGVGHETARGSLRWMAPELFGIRPKYSQKSDIYAYAVVLWEIVTCKIPYEDVTSELEIREAVRAGEREEIPSDCSADIAKLIQWCWKQKPENRPTANEVVAYLEKQSADKLTSSKSTKQKPWQVDVRIKPDTTTMTISYQLLEPTAEEKQKIVAYYQQYPVPGCEIGRVQVIYSPGVDLEFEMRLKKLQKRAGKPAFAPKWFNEGTNEHKAWRAKINEHYEKVTAPYTDSDYPNVKLMPVWHGTRKEVVGSILETGYANLATTDVGFFGKGIYSAFEAEYSYRLYSTQNYKRTDGVLLLNWVSSYSAYPVINSDRYSLKGRGNYANYDAHVVPVVPVAPEKDNPYALDYWACEPNQPAQYTEIAVFESSQCLPRYIIELQPNLPRPIPMEKEYLKFQRKQHSNFFKPESVNFRDKEKQSQENKRSPGVVKK